MGFHGREAACKPHITKFNARRRMEWCKAHRRWTVEQWKCVLWRDKSRFSVWQSDAQVWVWQMPGEHYLPDCAEPTVKFGGGGILVCGCFSRFGLGSILQRRTTLILQHTKTFWTMLCFQLWGNILSKALFYSNMIMPQCTKQGL